MALVGVFLVGLRAAGVVVRGYRRNPILKIALLVVGLVLFEAWFYWATHGWWEDISHRLAYYLPLSLIALGLIYVIRADSQNSDRYNSFSMASFGVLLASIVLTIRAANEFDDWIRRPADDGYEEFQLAGVVACIGIGLGLVGLTTIQCKRFGTRGRAMALAGILMPLGWGAIVYVGLFQTCERVHSGITLPESERRCWVNPYTDYEKERVAVDPSGTVHVLATGQSLANPVRIQDYLRDAASKMESAPFSRQQPDVLVPDEWLVVHADENVQFTVLEELFAVCGREDTQIWKVRLKFRYPDSECLCGVDLYLGLPAEDERVLRISRYSAGLSGLRLVLDDEIVGSPDELEQHFQTLDRSPQWREPRGVRLNVDAGVMWYEVLFVMNRYELAARSISEEVYFSMDAD